MPAPTRPFSPVAPALALALLTPLAACGAVAEQVAEEVIEESLEQEGVEVDLEGGEDGELTITFEDGDSEGTITADGDTGELQFETDDGEGTFTAGTGELPDDWPSDYPLPPGATVLSAGRFTEGDTTSWTAQFEGPAGAFDDYIDHFQGFATPLLNESETTSADGRFATYTWGTAERQSGFLILTGDDDAIVGQLQVSM